MRVPARLSTRTGAVLAWISATLYALIVLGLPYADIGVQRAVFGAAALAYAVGGTLLWRGTSRALLTLGAIANAAVIGIWGLRAIAGVSPSDGFAIASKLVEIALEAVLIARLVTPEPGRSGSSTPDAAP